MENFSWMALWETKILKILLDNQLHGGLWVLKLRSLPLQERRTLWWTAGKGEAVSWDITTPLGRCGKYQPSSLFLTSGRCSPLCSSGWMNAGARAGGAIAGWPTDSWCTAPCPLSCTERPCLLTDGKTLTTATGKALRVRGSPHDVFLRSELQGRE